MAARTVAVQVDIDHIMAEVKAYVDKQVAANVADLRRQVADLTEERDLLVRQLVALTAAIAEQPEPTTALLDAYAAATNRTIHEAPRCDHDWTTVDTLGGLEGVPFCAVCGVVKRRDSANAQCKGPRRVELREVAR